MERQILNLLVIVVVLTAEAKVMTDHGMELGGTILKDKLPSGIPQVNDKLLRGKPQVNGKRLRGMPQVNDKLLRRSTHKADATTRIDATYEHFLDFYKYKTTTASSPGVASSINTCKAASSTPPTVTISVYAHRAAGGTVFLEHRIKERCAVSCFSDRRSEALTANTTESCANAVESSGWANSFSFIDDECVIYAAWIHSKFTQGSVCDGEYPYYVAKNKINNFTDYEQPFVYAMNTLSRVGLAFSLMDHCISTAKVEVTTQFGSRTYENLFPTEISYFYYPFNSNLCTLNPPNITANVTFYDFDGKVLWAETVERLGPDASGGAMHLLSGDYGHLCVYQLADMGVHYDEFYTYTCSAMSESTTAFRQTSFLTYASYRQIISTISGGVPSHFVAAHYGDTWHWDYTHQPIGAEDFVGGTIPDTTIGECLIANSDQNYLLEPFDCSTPSTVVCVDFSALSYPVNLYG